MGLCLGSARHAGRVLVIGGRSLYAALHAWCAWCRNDRGEARSPMSSAILYLAIVAIWACVLIPRWLRRDSARGAAAAQTSAPPAPVAREDPAIAEPAGQPPDYPAEDADD